MSYTQNKEEINKVFQINSLNNRGRFFLRTNDQESARECFLNALKIDDKNYDALIALLLIEGNYKDEDELIKHYQDLYIKEESERSVACEFADELIDELKARYCIEGYLSEEKIDELFTYEEDITFDSRYECFLKQKQQIESEIKNDPYLSKLSESNDPEAKQLIEKIMEPYNSRLEEAENTDQYERMKIATAYRRFVEKQSEEVKQLAKEAEEKKDSDYNGAIELFEQAKDIEDYETLVEIFKSFKGYKQTDEYIEKCLSRIEEIRSRQKEIERQTRIRELLNKADECLIGSDFEKADELYFEVISIDADNDDAYLGTLLAENRISYKEDLSGVYYKDDFTPLRIKAINEATDTIDNCIEKYYLPEYLEKETIRKLFAYDDFYYDSYYQSAVDKKEEFKKEFLDNQTISWLMDHNDSYINNLYRELNEKYDAKIQEFKKNDELQDTNKKVTYQRFVKNVNRDIKKRYDEAVKSKQDDYEKAVNLLRTGQTVKQIKEVKRILNRLGDYKDSKDLLFEALNKIEDLKEVEKQEELKRELNGYIEEADSLLKEGKFEEADLIYQKVFASDSNNVDARIGLLMVENSCHDIDELIDKYQRQYSVNQFDFDQEVINGKSLIEDHINAMAEKYAVANKLERNIIVSLYNNEEIFYNSVTSKLEDLKKTLEDDMSIDENLIWICEQENNKVSNFFKEIKEEIDKAIENARKQDKDNETKTREKYEKYAKKIDGAVIDLYRRMVDPDYVEEEPHKKEVTEEPKQEEESLEKQEKPKEKKKLKFNLSGLLDKAKEEKPERQENEVTIQPEVTTVEEEIVPEPIQTYTEPILEQQQPEIVSAEPLSIDEPKEEETVEEPEVVKEPVKAKEKTKKERKKKEKAEDSLPGGRGTIVVMIIAILAIAAIEINIIYRRYIKPGRLYNEAVELLEGKQYEEAAAIFRELGDYKDASAMADESFYRKAADLYESGNLVGALNVLKDMNTEQSKNRLNEIKKEIISNAETGDTVIYGTYEQDDVKENGKELIEWIVLDVNENNELLLLSKYGLDNQPFDTTDNETVDWENSTIRFWLNHRFMDNAFAGEDHSLLQETTLSNIRYDEYGNEEEYETQDRVFLLSAEEVDLYMPYPEDRACIAAQYLINSGTIVNEEKACSWELRSFVETGKIEYIWMNGGNVSTTEKDLIYPIRAAIIIKK